MLYLLWDLKQKVGHATRTVDECLRQARADMTIRTTLLECRFLLGDRALLDTLLQRFDHEIVRNTAPEFVAAKLAERDQRVQRAGSSRYLVEPNVKEGKGGMRDLNTLFWIAKYTYRVQDADSLVGVGLFSEQELRLFRRCETFLWKVRCFMHFLTGRPEERLSFELQRQIAEQLGYAARGGLSGVERFMKHYFTVAKHVGDLTNIVCAALEERQAKPRAVFDRFVGKLRRRAKPRDLGPFALETDRVTVSSTDIFDKDPINLIRLFHVAARNELPIHPDALRLVTQSLPRIGNKLRADPEANRLFLEILTTPKSSERALRLMNEAGVLGRFIPDFGRIVAMMQFNMYHHYTVDEHLIRSLGQLAAVDLGETIAELPLTSSIMPTISHRRALYVAMLLHDIAKGRKEDHSIAGAQIARALGPASRLERGGDGSRRLAGRGAPDHVEHRAKPRSRRPAHHRSLRQDRADRSSGSRCCWCSPSATFARSVRASGTPGRASFCARSIGKPRSCWPAAIPRSTAGAACRNRKPNCAKSYPPGRITNSPDYAARHYPAYWLKVDLPHRIEHALLLHASAVEMNSLATEVATDAFRGITELTVIAPDHHRLLSIIAGACAASGANIVDAQIFTTTDGLALDTISISRAFERDEDEMRRGQRIARAIEQALRGEIRLGDIVAAKADNGPSHADTFNVPPDVVIDNSLSHMYSVVEVSGLDRPGLLYDLTMTLSKLNLNIASAHVVTFGEKAVDTFYVSDLTGAKVVNPARQASVRRNLMDVFNAKRKA